MAKYYIQRRDKRVTETVDEFDSKKEAKKILHEYVISDTSANYYISTRATKHWRNSKY